MAEHQPSFACDAMCGGLARWLRAIGYDATFWPHIDDAQLIQHARQDGRILVSSDGKIFERKVITSGQIAALRLPRGLKRIDQIRYVVRTLRLKIRQPRCMKCNGQLLPASREEVANLVPARSLVWARTFYRCNHCGRAFWDGTHWQRITARRAELARLLDESPPPRQD